MTIQSETKQLDGIAIIGIVGRFPGAASVERLWTNLCVGAESITEFADEQLLSAGIDPCLVASPNYVKSNFLLDGIDLFDASFFGISPREAELTDPQHRIFLECAWEALEDAGYDPDQTPLRIGVYAGVGTNSYFRNNVFPNQALLKPLTNLQKWVAIDNDYVSTRVSYKLNLKGPSLTIQTACSTSLVAVHMACQSLLNFECDMALSGGASIQVPQTSGYLYQEGANLSPDGHCRAFDADARGMVEGSGACVVVLKRLAEAVADGDSIRAVIRGSAINNDGAVKIGYTAPSVDGQAAVIAEAQAMAGVRADEVTYVETHGTGTSLGDPIEIAGLTKAFRRTTQRNRFCAIGAIKANIGHLGAAAGVTGLVKTVLSLQNRMIPPSRNFKRPNPAIDFENSPFYVQTELSEWQPASGRRIAGVSAFGIGGTNAHVIVEEAPPAPASHSSCRWQLLTLSARTPEALEKATYRLAEFLESHPSLNVADVAFTLQHGRRSFDYRRFLVAKNIDEATAVLKSRESKRMLTGTQDPSHSPVAFMFPGQGTQRVNMGLGLYENEKSFRKEVDSCCELLRPHLGLDLRILLYPPTDKAAGAAERLNETEITQPAVFVLEYSLAKLWMEWGLRPDAMIGHSIGEYVAACLAGVFSLEDALALVAGRGRLMQSLPRGSMLGVLLDEKSIQQYLINDLSLAATNAPSACVVAGPIDAIRRLQVCLAGKQIGCRLLHTSHGFHSQMMDPILEPFRELFKNVTLSPPKIPYISNLTGTWINPMQATDPGYWERHLRHTVRFAQGVGELLKTCNRVLLEVGPGRTLASLAKQNGINIPDQVALASLGYEKDETSESSEMMLTLGQLWLRGVQMDLSALYKGERRHRVCLPTYPFERHRYWVDAKKSDITTSAAEACLQDSPNSRTEVSDFRQQSDSRSLLHQRPELRNEYVAPRTNVHEVLATLWCEVLGFEKIGIDDNFFHLGGDSLLALEVISRVRVVFRMELPPNILFDSQTIDKLALRMIAGESRPGLVERTADIVRQIEDMSEEEISQNLRASGSAAF